jgi:branched-chain amino acid transport system ATP-binding protein
MSADIAPILTLDNVNAFVGTSRILQGVSFMAEPGKVTMIIGRNGVGKTTTLRSIMGLNKSRGAIRFLGEDISGLAPHHVAQRGIGYVPEDRDVFHGLTVEENLRLAERPGQTPRYDLVFQVFPELKQRAKQAAGTLSGGQQQMVSVGRVLLNETALLLIDEPTKGLAPRIVSELTEVLEQVASTTTIVMVEQNIGVVRRLADKLLVMDRGMIVAEGDAGEILSDEDRVRGYLGVGRHQEQVR